MGRTILPSSAYLIITTMRLAIKLLPAAIVCLLFSQTLGSLVQTAQTLDRVTAGKVAQLASLE